MVKKMLYMLLCCALLFGILAGCAGNGSQEETNLPSDAVSTVPESHLPQESGTLPALPSLSFRQDAQFLPLEQAQRDARFTGWLPAGNPFPSMNSRVAYNERMAYVIVVFSGQEADETIYVTLHPDETGGDGVRPEKSQWNGALQQYDMGWGLSLSVASKSADIYTTGTQPVNLIAAAEWIAGP